MRGARARARECLQVAVDLVEDVVIDGRPDKVDLKPWKLKLKFCRQKRSQVGGYQPVHKCPGAK